jgi:hypothetical protein
MDQLGRESLPVDETPQTREYYSRWRGVCVTGAWFTAHDRHFAIRDLVMPTERPGSMRAARRVSLFLILVETLVVALAVAGSVAVDGISPFVIELIVGYIAATLIVFAFSALRWPTPLELWARHQGQPTLLFVCYDQIEFGKVRRALERAIGARAEPCVSSTP